ncbi:MAG: helix-turn-helix transcriptional regulator [Leucobacter sp.]
MTRNLGRRRWATERWEQHLGDQIRRARQDAGISQADLARRANVNRNSISSLERGEGSSLATLIKAVRALGLDQWLDELAPEPGPSPLALLREQQSRQVQRVRSRPDETGA